MSAAKRRRPLYAEMNGKKARPRSTAISARLDDEHIQSQRLVLFLSMLLRGIVVGGPLRSGGGAKRRGWGGRNQKKSA